LAICLSGGKNRLADLTDDELLQVAAAARRQTSWAQARELAAIAELTRRRTAEEESGDPDYRILSARESVTEEVSAALTVTGNTAATLVHLAEQLTGPLTRTGDALEAGRLDLAKARVICDTTEHLPPETTRRVEHAALDKASEQTTGQLRRRIKRIAQRLAPEAVEERRREAVRQRRLELWDTPSGTSDLALCDLPAEDAHAIYNKITAAAHGIKTDGDTRSLSTIRADLAAQLLHGAPLPDAIRALLAQAGENTGPTVGPTSPTRPPLSAPAGARSGPDTAAGGEGIPGGCHPAGPARHSAGLAQVRGSAQPAVAEEERSPGDAEVAALADAVARRLDHVRGRVHPRELPQAVRQTVERIRSQFTDARDAACQGDDESHGRPGYRPSAVMRREVEARHATCVFPTCNQPSDHCDLDHTIPWRPGITCRCNLAPLCRRHHRLKQRTDWRLFQIWPGLLIWVTPSGAWYVVRPDRK
jgi:hypothetical protein